MIGAQKKSGCSNVLQSHHDHQRHAMPASIVQACHQTNLSRHTSFCLLIFSDHCSQEFFQFGFGSLLVGCAWANLSRICWCIHKNHLILSVRGFSPDVPGVSAQASKHSCLPVSHDHKSADPAKCCAFVTSSMLQCTVTQLVLSRDSQDMRLTR